MYLLRIFQILCVLTFATTSIHANTSPQTKTVFKSAVHHVQKFGEELVESLKNGESLDKFRTLIRSHFNLSHLAKQCCPVKYEKLSSDQIKEYEKKFEESVCKEYFSLLGRYYTPKGSVNDHFRIDEAKSKQYPSGSGVCASICTAVFTSNGARVDVYWIVKGGKIENFIVEKTDMRLAKKRDLKTRFKQRGSDIRTFLNTLSESTTSSE